MTQDLKSRIHRLEVRSSEVKGVAGIVHGRGQDYDLAAHAHIDRQVAELHAAGHSVVYVASLAGRQRAITVDATTSQPPRN